jgi:acyl-CoA thioester hydrolase
MAARTFPRVEEVSALPVTHRGVVAPEWIDVMGHMNVAWYTHVFSHGVGGLLELIGTTPEVFEKGRVATVALEVHVHYLRELHLGARLRVHGRLLGVSQKRFHQVSFIVDEGAGRLAAVSEGVGTYFDKEARRAVAMPPDVAERARRLVAEHAALPWPAPVTGTMGA